MWKAGVVHRDLKPANVFMKDSQVKIADFGFATDITKCSKPFAYNLGSPSYMSPEALRRNEYSFQSDIWAIGVIAFELVYGRIPWISTSDLFLYQMLINEPIKGIIEKERPVSKVIQDFIVGCCSLSLKSRLQPEEIISYDWTGRMMLTSIIVKPKDTSRIGLHQ
jgi:serine/threonine-protein kinase ULK/ATG1